MLKACAEVFYICYNGLPKITLWQYPMRKHVLFLYKGTVWINHLGSRESDFFLAVNCLLPLTFRGVL